MLNWLRPDYIPLRLHIADMTNHSEIWFDMAVSVGGGRGSTTSYINYFITSDSFL